MAIQRLRSVHNLLIYEPVSYSFLSGSAWLILNTLFGSGFGYVYWYVAARIYPPEQLGLGAAVLSSLTLLAATGELGMGTLLLRYLPSASVEKTALTTTLFSLASLATVLVAFVYILATRVFSPAISQAFYSPTLAGIYIASVLFFGFGQMLDRWLIASGNPKRVFLRNIIAQIIRISLIPGLAQPLSATGLAANTGAGSLVSGMVTIIWFCRRSFWSVFDFRHVSISPLIGKVRYALTNHLAQLLWIAPPLLIPTILVHRLGPASGAQFYIPWMVANLLFIVPVSCSTILFAQSATNSPGLEPRFWKTMVILLCILLPAALVMMALSGPILHLFGKNLEATGKRLLILLLISIFPYTINCFAAVFFKVHEDLQGVLITTFTGSIATILAVTILIRPLHLSGAGWGWIAGQVIEAFISLYYVKNRKVDDDLLLSGL